MFMFCLLHCKKCTQYFFQWKFESYQCWFFCTFTNQTSMYILSHVIFHLWLGESSLAFGFWLFALKFWEVVGTYEWYSAFPDTMRWWRHSNTTLCNIICTHRWQGHQNFPSLPGTISLSHLVEFPLPNCISMTTSWLSNRWHYYLARILKMHCVRTLKEKNRNSITHSHLKVHNAPFKVIIGNYGIMWGEHVNGENSWTTSIVVPQRIIMTPDSLHIQSRRLWKVFNVPQLIS